MNETKLIYAFIIAAIIYAGHLNSINDAVRNAGIDCTQSHEQGQQVQQSLDDALKEIQILYNLED